MSFNFSNISSGLTNFVNEAKGFYDEVVTELSTKNLPTSNKTDKALKTELTRGIVVNEDKLQDLMVQERSPTPAQTEISLSVEYMELFEKYSQRKKDEQKHRLMVEEFKLQNEALKDALNEQISCREKQAEEILELKRKENETGNSRIEDDDNELIEGRVVLEGSSVKDNKAELEALNGKYEELKDKCKKMKIFASKKQKEKVRQDERIKELEGEVEMLRKEKNNNSGGECKGEVGKNDYDSWESGVLFCKRIFKETEIMVQGVKKFNENLMVSGREEDKKESEGEGKDVGLVKEIIGKTEELQMLQCEYVAQLALFKKKWKKIEENNAEEVLELD